MKPLSNKLYTNNIEAISDDTKYFFKNVAAVCRRAGSPAVRLACGCAGCVGALIYLEVLEVLEILGL
jgi:hypothetical protein